MPTIKSRNGQNDLFRTNVKLIAYELGNRHRHFICGIHCHDLYFHFPGGRTKSDLVADDYYAQELAYESVIEATRNTLPFTR